MKAGARWLAWSSWAVVIVGFGLRLGIAARTLDVVDRMFVPDDTYYTLGIARSLARGLGPTADGVHLTNGFQPLLAFLLVPVFWVAQGPDTPLRVAWIVLSACDVVTALSLGALAHRAAQRNGAVAALTATAAWSLSPLAVSYAMGGLETSLALMCGVLLTLAWSRARASRLPRDAVVAGVAAGACLLARIDLSLLVVGLGGLEVLAGHRRNAVRAATSAAVVVAPWWIYELSRFGTVIPTSGAAVRAQAAIHQAHWLTRDRQLSWAVGTVLEAPIGRLRDLRDLFGEHLVGSLPSELASAAVVLTVCAAMLWLVARGPARAPVCILMGFGVAVWAFYALYLPAVWFFPRYLAPMHVTLTLVLALLVAALAGPGVLRAASSGLVFVTVALLPALVTVRYTWLVPSGGSLDVGKHGAKGYRFPALQILAQLPPDAVLGTLQSGALGYYGLEQGRTVVNLDGVVDEQAARVFRAGALGELARSRGVNHVADWVWNVDVLLSHWDATIRPKLVPIGQAPEQGTDRFTLFRLE